MSCCKCNQRILKSKVGVQCCLCCDVCHTVCASPIVTSDDYDLIQNDSIQWFCSNCQINRSILPASSDVTNNGNSELDKLKMDMSKFAINLNNIKCKQFEFTESLNSLTNNFEQLMMASSILIEHKTRIESLENANI